MRDTAARYFHLKILKYAISYVIWIKWYTDQDNNKKSFRKGSEWLSVGIRAWSEELAGELNFWIDSLVAIIRSRGLVLLTIVTLRG